MSIENTLDKHLQEEQMIRYIIKWVAITFCIFIATIAGCSMHSNMYDGERGMAEAAQREADAKYRTAQNEIDVEEIAAIERLINTGTNPIQAACAIKGFGDDHVGCSIAASK